MKINIGPYPDKVEDRNVLIHIDSYDTWAVDSTLAMIIAPMLKQLKDTKHGAPYTDDIDVPAELWSDEVDEHGIGINHWKKWDWILDEMIWAFSEYDNLKYGIGFEQTQERLSNALRLFGKYYQALWD